MELVSCYIEKEEKRKANKKEQIINELIRIIEEESLKPFKSNIEQKLAPFTNL